MCLIVPGWEGKYIFKQESFYLQGILNDINEQNTYFLDCKHKHMMKTELHKKKIPAPSVTYRIPWFLKQN